MRIVLEHNIPSNSVVFDGVHEIIFQPEAVWLFLKPPSVEALEAGTIPADIIIPQQKTAGRPYWNYRGTWYPQFRITDPEEAVQLRLI